jgi:penicillin-binding protein 1C
MFLKKISRRRLGGAALLLLGLALFAVLVPPSQSLLKPSPVGTLRILDRNGELLYEHRGDAAGMHERIALNDIPKPIVEAIVSIEDRTFFEHGGLSARGIARAAVQNFKAGGIVEGGSTITQQLVRIREPASRSFLNKIVEMLRAWKVDNVLSKNDILESYVNEAYFGHRAYGISAAAQTYFGKSVQELSLGESALLAGLLQSPSGYDPFRSLQKARDRRMDVLAAMKRDGHITEAEEKEANAEAIFLAPDRVEIEAPHFVFWLLDREDLPKSGTVTTTLDLALQHDAERAVAAQLKRLDGKNVTSAAVVVLDAHTGDVLAMVGSADYFDSEHDGAVNVAISPRQPGSAVKPFTYALAFTQGATAATTVADVETQFFTQDGNPYTPRNYDYGFHGLVRYREALANSYNIAAVKVLERVGVGNLLAFLRDVGMSELTESPEHYGLALTLGDAEVSLLELTRAFGMFARNGVTLTERSLPTDPIVPGRRVLNAGPAWLISDILDDDNARLPEFGENGPLEFPFPVAAKTGTTRNSRDNWTIGYTPDRVVGVWVGNADNTPMKGTSGITGAGPIFHDVMLAATRDLPVTEFVRPAGVTEQSVCAISGKLPTPACPRIVSELFLPGTVPTDNDDLFVTVAIDKRNGLRATDACPPQEIEQRVFAVFPSDARTWALQNGWKEPPRDVSPLCNGGSAGTIANERWIVITKPHDGDEFKLDPLVKDENELITLEASAGTSIKTIEWYVNGTNVGEGSAPNFRVRWKPGVGEWRVEARSGELRETLRFSVVR